MNKKAIFVVPIALYSTEINDLCFDKCGKVNIGLFLNDPILGGVSNCNEKNCPYAAHTAPVP